MLLRNTLRIVLVSILILEFGCIQNVNLNLDKKEPGIVLNCFLNTEKDTITARLTKTRSIESGYAFESISNAEITLFEEGDIIGGFSWVDSSEYILAYTVKAGKTYRIEVNAEKRNVWAETTIPSQVEASIDYADPEFPSPHYRITMTDSKEEENYYWVSAIGYRGAEGNRFKDIAGLLYSNFEYADDFNRNLYQDGYFRFEYSYYLRFTDFELPGNNVDLIVYPQSIGYPLEVFLLSTDYHLDKYMKSSILLQQMETDAEEMPIIYAPFPSYSNIHGGTGIFGSMTSVSKQFTRY